LLPQPANRLTEPADAGHVRWRGLHAVGWTFATAVRMLPRRWRFGAAMRFARAAEPLLRRTPAFRVQDVWNVDGAPEIATHLVLWTLTRHGVRFDPVIVARGYEGLLRAHAEGRGVLLVAAHAALGVTAIHFFHRDALAPIIVAPEPQMRVPGTAVFVETVQPAPTFLLSVRDRLRAGRLVGTMLDVLEHHGDLTFEFDTPRGSAIMSSALLQVAVRCEARVVFMEVHVEKGRLVGCFVTPASDTVEGLTEEFIAYVRQHQERRCAAAIAPAAPPAPRRAPRTRPAAAPWSAGSGSSRRTAAR